jgi:hypothetical protein
MKGYNATIGSEEAPRRILSRHFKLEMYLREVMHDILTCTNSTV